MKKVLVLLIAAFMGLQLSAQQMSVAPKKEASVTIQTNGICEKCGARMKTSLTGVKGVQTCQYDVTNAKMVIHYDPTMTNPDQLRKVISEVGYNADKVQANAEARAKLPACCRGEKSSCGSTSGEHKCQGHQADGKSSKTCGNQSATGTHSCGNTSSATHSCSGQCKNHTK